jgi:leukotriene-A4 hydrolase
LIAIASGNVRYKPFPKFEDKQWRTGIWAEPELLDAAYWEFSADTARSVLARAHMSAAFSTALGSWRPKKRL